MRLLVGQVKDVLCRLCLAYSGGVPRRTCAFLFLALGFVGLDFGLCASVLEMSVVLRERFQFIHSFIRKNSVVLAFGQNGKSVSDTRSEQNGKRLFAAAGRRKMVKIALLTIMSTQNGKYRWAGRRRRLAKKCKSDPFFSGPEQNGKSPRASRNPTLAL